MGSGLDGRTEGTAGGMLEGMPSPAFLSPSQRWPLVEPCPLPALTAAETWCWGRLAQPQGARAW